MRLSDLVHDLPPIMCAATGCVLLLIAVPSSAQDNARYKDAHAPVDQRVRDLLSRMTLEEKTAQLRSMWSTKALILDSAGNFSPHNAQQSIPDGIGQIARPSDTAGAPALQATPYRGVQDTVTLINAVQHFLVEQTRLGIPALFHDEAAHGFAEEGATIFPIAPALASTWDPALVQQAFAVAAREARVRGTSLVLSPVLDLMRDPRYGRSEEFFGEDPYLVAQMGIAAVRGLQGAGRPIASDHVFATLKHFVHGAPQGGLNTAPADISERTLRETFLVPFAAVIQATDPAVIMPSYNEIEGVPSHANVELLQKTGRERLGFRGAYFSDYEGIGNLASQHHVATDAAAAAILALNAGVDVDLPEGQSYAHLPELVRAGRIAQAKVDAAVARILALKFEAGLFEHPYVDAARAMRETNTSADIRLARKSAEEALVLLKNDGILPLNARAKLRLAVIGPNAAQPMFGGYSGVNKRAVSILAGLQAAAGPGICVSHADGVWITQPEPANPYAMRPSALAVPAADNASRIAQALEVANNSDVILLVLGDNTRTTREAVGESWPGDRSTLGLFGDQDALVDAMLATHKPIITLLLNGRPLAVNRLADKSNALLEGWYLGQEGGNAFADVLFGKVNPGGKLPESFPRAVGELPVFYDRHPSANSNRYIEGRREPLFPFGYGLSYTSFAVSAPRLSKQQISPTDDVDVDVDVTNTGSRLGDEVVQLYIRDDVSSVPRPVLELKAFRRLTLKPQETQTVRFQLTPDALAFWNIDMQWLVEPGTFAILAGDSSVALKSATLTVGSER